MEIKTFKAKTMRDAAGRLVRRELGPACGGACIRGRGANGGPIGRLGVWAAQYEVAASLNRECAESAARWKLVRSCA